MGKTKNKRSRTAGRGPSRGTGDGERAPRGAGGTPGGRWHLGTPSAGAAGSLRFPYQHPPAHGVVRGPEENTCNTARTWGPWGAPPWHHHLQGTDGSQPQGHRTAEQRVLTSPRSAQPRKPERGPEASAPRSPTLRCHAFPGQVTPLPHPGAGSAARGCQTGHLAASLWSHVHCGVKATAR